MYYGHVFHSQSRSYMPPKSYIKSPGQLRTAITLFEFGVCTRTKVILLGGKEKENGNYKQEPKMVSYLIQEQSKWEPKRVPQNMAGVPPKKGPRNQTKLNQCIPFVFCLARIAFCSMSVLESELSIGILA